MKSLKNKNGKPLGTVLFMTAATLLSKLLGMLRGIIIAAVYGDSMEANAFTVAQHIPLTCFDILLSAAILGCFIPVYAGFFTSDSDDKAGNGGDEFALIFLNVIILLTSLLAVVGIIFANPIVSLMAPGLEGETKELAVMLLRILFPMIIFTGSAFTLVGVMQTKGKYLLPSMISAISNACIILYLLAAAPFLGDNSIIGLAIAYLFAWFVQFMTLAVPLKRSGFKFRPVLDFKNPALRESMKKLPPIMAGSWLMPVTIYSGVSFTSLITEKVALFEYANSIYVLVTGILTYSLCNYIFPKLSKLSESGEADGYGTAASQSLKIVLAVILPFTAAVAVLYGEGTSILYLRKNFGAESAALTAGIVRMMSLGMPFFAINELLSRAFYAKKQTFPPMLAALCGIAVNIAVSAAVTSLPQSEVHFIGIPYALGQAVSAVVLLILFVVSQRSSFTFGYVIDVLKILASAAVSFALMMAVHGFIGKTPYTSGMFMNILVCAAVFIPAAAVYLVLLKLTGVRFDNLKTEKVTKSE